MSYSHKANGKRPYARLSYTSEEPSLTKTSFADEADINVIVGRFLKTGLLPTTPVPPQYLDLTNVPVGTDALMAVRNAQMAFEALPLELRREIGHDPRELEGWLQNPENEAKAIRLGLIAPKGGPSKEPAPAEQALGAGDPPPSQKPVAKDETKK